jgi:hypothetical protein
MFALQAATVMVWLPTTVLLQKSVALHVRVSTMGLPPADDSPKDTATFVSQLSTAKTAAVAGMVQMTDVFDGTPTRIGDSVSDTVMTWTAAVELPQESSTVHVRVNV